MTVKQLVDSLAKIAEKEPDMKVYKTVADGREPVSEASMVTEDTLYPVPSKFRCVVLG
jgi:hypothetical protein